MNNNLPIPKSLTACTILYMALLIYASLMPYDFSAEIDYKRVISHAWSHWPFNAKARISGSDIVSNLALYIPLGFLIASVYRHKSSRFLPAFVTTVLAATLLSLSIEL
ncbi:MAG: VanZ family protein, partial [Desulfuromonadales bacterium]|nr:VanZ family protein [Desulfuromonadales bacterium]